MIRLALLLLLLALPAQAEEVVAGLSRDRISITTNFDGSEVLIFGAVKREAPIPEGGPLEVVITLAGPSEPVTVRRKSRRYGIWINTSSVEIDAAPSFYAVATSGPLRDVLTNTEDLRHRISIPRAIRSVGAPANVENSIAFTEALMRIREAGELYQLKENSIDVRDQTLFQTAIRLPANLVEGDYKTRIFLTREAEIVSSYETVINVEKVGLERWLFTLAHERPLVYGLLSITIAIFAGWGASALFRLVRP